MKEVSEGQGEKERWTYSLTRKKGRENAFASRRPFMMGFQESMKEERGSGRVGRVIIGLVRRTLPKNMSARCN